MTEADLYHALRSQVRDPWADIWLHTNASLDQRAWRFRNDDGGQTGATWAALENSSAVLDADVTYRLRVQVDDTASGGENNVAFQLQYQLNSGGWNNVDGTSAVVRSTATSHYVDGGSTTAQLSVPSGGTFIGSNSGLDESDGLAGNVSFSDGTHDYVEVEYAFQVLGTDVVDGDTVEFRVIRGGGTVLNSYSGGSATASVGAADITVTGTQATETDRALTPTGPYPDEVLADNPIAYWRLGEASGTTATDETGAQDGTYQGAPVLGVEGLVTGDDTAVDFDGPDYMESPAFFDPAAAGDFTVEMWLHIDTLSGGNLVAMHQFDGSGTGRAYVRYDGQADAFVSQLGGQTLSTGLTPVIGQAYHIILRYSGSTLQFFVDGEPAGSATRTMETATGGLVFGISKNLNNGWDGVLDELAIYDAALSNTRIQTHYDAGTAPEAPDTSVTGTQAAETDTANPGSPTVIWNVTGTQATETDTASAGQATQGVSVTGSQATETDSSLAGAVTVTVTATGTQATETDTAQAGSHTTTVSAAGAQASETDTAFAGSTTTGVAVPGSQVTETDTPGSGSVTGTWNVTGTQATETDSALGGAHTAAWNVAGTQATETDSAQAGSTESSSGTLGTRAAETDTANTGSVSATVIGSQATEADAPRAGAASVGETVAGSQAAETDTASAGAPTAEWNVAGTQVTETDTSNEGSPSATITGSQTAEADTPRTGTVSVGESVGGSQATESDTALAGSSAAEWNVSGTQVDETDSAQAGSATVIWSVAGTQATEADVANAGSVDRQVPGSQATETDTVFAGIIAFNYPGTQATETDLARAGVIPNVVRTLVATLSDQASVGASSSESISVGSSTSDRHPVDTGS